MTFHQGSLTAQTLPGKEHWIDKRGIKLFLWEKQRASGSESAGTILFIHGSSWASLPTFDLQNVPNAALVRHGLVAARLRLLVFRQRGYGRSDKHRDIQFGIETGAEDIEAATDYILSCAR